MKAAAGRSQVNPDQDMVEVAAVTKVLRRTGLKFFTEIKINDPESPDAAAALRAQILRWAPIPRFKRCARRASKYPEVDGLAEEIKWVESAFKKRGQSRAIEWALTAIERALDLLDTGKHLRAVIQAARYSEAQRKRRFDKPDNEASDPSRNDRIRSVHRRLVEAGQTDATKQTAEQFGISTRQISTIVKRGRKQPG